MRFSKVKLLIGLVFTGFAIVLGIECCRQPSNQKDAPAGNSFMGNESCKTCHQQEHELWTNSHHFMAMQAANDSTVLGDFNNASFTADGVTNQFFKKDGKFYINTQDADGQYRDFEILYTFGFTPLQQYLVAFPGGKMQATRATWDTEKKKWFHQYAGDKIPAGDWLHWTGNAQNWNTMCASCHSTNLQKGYDPQTDTYNTTYNDINVSCESCHGEGKNHIDYINGAYADGDRIAGSLIKLYKNAGQHAEINTCAFCHARRVDITGSVLPEKELLNDFLPEIPTTQFFYADGQMQDEDYNYTSFLQSKMYSRGVQCSNCHNPHSGKLKLENSLVCSQCHASEQYAIPAHTMHSESLTQVNCVTCHMPSKVYMGNDERHDHSFRIPRPDLTAKYGTPNTCNSCHTNESAQWAADKISTHFGANRTYHFSEHLIPGSRLNGESEGHLNALMQDTATPNIVKAAALHYLSQLATPAAAKTMVNHLNDTNALVRYHVVNGLGNTNSSAWSAVAQNMFADPVRAVRIAAARLYLDMPNEQIPSTVFQPFTNAKNELYRFIMYQTDFAVGNVQAGDYFGRTGDISNAEFYYRRAIAKDSQLAVARVNLASILNQKAQNEEALKQLQIATKLEPNSDHVHYSLGLLYAEMSNMPEAEKSLKRAIALNPNNLRASYNYGLILQQGGKPKEAEQAFLAALKISPNDGDLLYALTILYAQTRQADKARQTGMLLKQYHGNNPNYQQLFQQLRLG